MAPIGKYRTAGEYVEPSRSRLSLRMLAGCWRTLQCVGMSLHYLAPPRPPSPAMTKTVPCTVAKKEGSFHIHIYTPPGYNQKRIRNRGRKYPAVVNFHGGGFTIGSGTDDARFARFVLETCNALFISVDYRLAPEFPFPTAVDDGADALLYVIEHAEDLRVNPMKIATSGFSAGGNLAMTSPLRLAIYLDSLASEPADSVAKKSVPEHCIVAAATWYPITDYTLTRAERRATAVRIDQTLPRKLTDLFDASYLFPPDLDLADPCLSPSKASDELLKRGIPAHVIFFTCEWDMLLREGEDLAKRLGSPDIGKDVRYKKILGVPHGWDKMPDLIKPAPQSEKLYKECTKHLNEIFEKK